MSLPPNVNRSRARSITYLILFAVGLAIGIPLGVNFVGTLSDSGSTEQAAQDPTATPDPDDQRRVLIVGVDRVGTSQPRLQAIWYTAYIPDVPVVTLLPLYPASHLSSAGQAQVLEEAFSLDPSGELHPNFLNTIENQFRLKWHMAILVDDFAMMAMVDFMGGIGPGDNPANGVTTIGNIPPAWEDPQGALEGQLSLLRALCDEVSSDDQDRDIEALVLLQPGHLRTDPGNLIQLQSDWLSMLLLKADIRCDFPGLDLPQS